VKAGRLYRTFLMVLGSMVAAAGASAAVVQNTMYTMADIDADATWIKTGAGTLNPSTNTITGDLEIYHDFAIGGAVDGDKGWLVEALVSSQKPATGPAEAGARLFVRINSDDIAANPNSYHEIQVRLLKQASDANNYIGLFDAAGNLVNDINGNPAKIVHDWSAFNARSCIRLMRQDDQIILSVENYECILFENSSYSQSVTVALNSANFPALTGIVEAKQIGFGNLLATANQNSTWSSIHITTTDDKVTTLPYWPLIPPTPELTVSPGTTGHDVTLKSSLTVGGYLTNDIAILDIYAWMAYHSSNPIIDPGAAPAQHEYTVTEMPSVRFLHGTVSIYDVSGRASRSPPDPIEDERCFIATAAFGSYLHKDVMVLRQFRDHYLLTNSFGQMLVSAYYKYSPPIANYIARHELLRALTRFALTPIVYVIKYPSLLLVTLILLGFVIFRKRFRKNTNNI
jgi:hypothetical protein